MKIKRTDFVIVISFAMLSIASGMAVFFSSGADVTSKAITTSTAVIGTFGIVFQMIKGKRLNEGTFIVTLRKEFVANQHIYALCQKLEKYERLVVKPDKYFNEDDITMIAEYMTFFEMTYLLIKRGILKVQMIDLLFAFHFFLLLNNKQIQELELLPCQNYYIDVLRLYKQWKEYRKKNNKDILNEQDDILTKLNPETMKEIYND